MSGIGRRVARDLLRLRSWTGAVGADVQNVIGCGHPLAEGTVEVGARLLHAPALACGELQSGQAADVVVVRNRGGGHHRRHAVNVGVPDQQGAFAMVVIHLASFRPVGRVGYRSLETVPHSGNARQDQADLRLQTPPSLVLSLVMNGHTTPTPFIRCRELSSIIGVEPGDSDTGKLPPSDPAELLPLAMSRPHDALLAARSLLAGQPSAYDASLAHHAIGIVLRDRGDLPAAIAELRRAMRLARASGRPEREADVQATLGTALAWTGRSRQGLATAGPGRRGLSRGPGRTRAHAARHDPL